MWSIDDEDGWPISPPCQQLRASEDPTQSDDSGIENGEDNKNALSQQQQQQRETHSNQNSHPDEQIQQKNTKLQQPNELKHMSTEIDIPILSPQTPTEEQPFPNPMERLRKRTELKIKDSFATSPPTSGRSTSPFYGFPHRRSVVIDGRKCGKNKWCR